MEENIIVKTLELKRPLVFIDLETTGLDLEKDRIIEITICKISIDGTKEIKTKRFNPEVPIHPDATALHGITNEDVKDELPFKKFAKGLMKFIEGADIAGFRSNQFDNPMLFNEFTRSDVTWDYQSINFIDVANILTVKEPRTLAGVYKHYCDKELVDSHSSKADILATVEIFEAQLQKYDDLPTDMGELDRLSNFDAIRVDIGGKFAKNEEGELIFNFGKNKGVLCKSEKGFLEWMVNKASFTSDVNTIVNKLLEEIKTETR